MPGRAAPAGVGVERVCFRPDRGYPAVPRRYTFRIDVLLVCTANVCRSPMAEVLLRAQFEEMCVAADVTSAGVLDGERPAAPGARSAMAARDLDLSSHRSRSLSSAQLADADVVLAMSREHVREVVMFDPGSWPKTFTLKELVRRAEQHGARSPGQPFDEWLAKIHVGRERHELLGESPLDDVADPVGGPPEQFEAAAQELSALLARFVELAWGAA